MSTLILLRHGQSMWNQRNVFTGWVDVPLSSNGISEAQKAGQLMSHLNIDAIYTSTLVRAQQTAMLAMAEHPENKVPFFVHTGTSQQLYNDFDQTDIDTMIPTYTDERLNERHYGGLQGLNKQKTVEKHGADQVKQWRRSYDTAPPEGESLAMTAERTLPCFQEAILPLLESGKNVLVSAHGNSLRSIVMHWESLSKDEVLGLEIATGEPRFYAFEGGAFQLQKNETSESSQ